MSLWITVPLCAVAAMAVAFGVLGVFALIDIAILNHKDDYE